MSSLRETLHAMPTLLLIVGAILLFVATLNDEVKDTLTQDPIDKVGSWLAFAVLLFLTVAYFWSPA